VHESEDFGADLDLARRFDSRGSAERAEAADQRDVEKGTTPPPPTSASGPLTLAPDDEENPRNWPAPKKWAVDFALSLWTLSLTYSSTAFVASLVAIEHKFKLSQEMVLFGVTLNV